MTYKFFKILSPICFGLALTACGGGGGGGSSDDDGDSGGGSTPPVNNTSGLSGTITYDRVPHDDSTNGLDYDETYSAPARGLVVQLLDANGSEIDLTTTDAAGFYQFDVEPNVDVRVRVRAEMRASLSGIGDVTVTDNTSDNALYVLNGQLLSTGSGASVRDLHAASGWNTSSSTYDSTRAAAPFAILDIIYEGMEALSSVDTDLTLPALEVRWSENNIAASGDYADGDIGTSFYTSAGDVIYLLGAADNDSDEYDQHLIVHEWGHFIESVLARSDSIGGGHSITDRLDMRVAWSEGWSNALAAMILNDPIYQDSGGLQQAFGFAIDMEENNYSDRGWFVEASIHSLLYDIFDSAEDGADTLALGLGPIYATLTDNEYLTFPGFASVFLFLEQFRTLYPSQTAAVNALAAAQEIGVADAWGVGETNDGDIAALLPIYQTGSIGSSQTLCTFDDYSSDGDTNRLGNHRYLRITSVSGGSYRIQLTESGSSPTSGTTPNLYIFNNLGFYRELTATSSGAIDWSGTLTESDYLLDLFELDAQAACYSLVITQN